MAVVTSCLLGLDLFDPPPWMEVVDLSGSPPQSVLLGQGRAARGGEGQTDPKQLLLNHQFSWRLLAAAGDGHGSRPPSVRPSYDCPERRRRPAA